MLTLHYNCTAGLSGDMNLGLMVSLGVDPQTLAAELEKLQLPGWRLTATAASRGGIAGTRVHIETPSDATADDETSRDSAHGRDHGRRHRHRHFRDIQTIIATSTLSAAVKSRAIDIFSALARVEGAIHGVSPLDVHFHEVGAVDSIVDIVGAAVCWELLGVDRITCSTIELGSGTIDCAHGRLPVPAPATAQLLVGCPVSLGGTSHEATTPTGAAILSSVVEEFNPALRGALRRSGFGIGARDISGVPNVVHGLLLEQLERVVSDADEAVWELAANLDDQTPESISFLCAQLLRSGALDVWQSPATFKKGRAGVVVHVLAAEQHRSSLVDKIFRESSTLGIRQQKWHRAVLRREIRSVQTPWGSVQVKDAFLGTVRVRSKPEFDDCQAIALRYDLPLDVVTQTALTAAEAPVA